MAVGSDLLGWLSEQLDSEGRDWLLRSLEGVGEELALRAAMAACPRHLRPAVGEGRDLDLPVQQPWVAGLAGPRGAWDLTRLCQALLFVQGVAAVEPSGRVSRLRNLLARSSASEQQLMLRCLMLLPQPSMFVELAIDACRTNVVDVFAAIACDNLFPARFFPQAAFNQLVLKAVFLELPLAPVLGLDDRVDGELARMARDFADERRAAGRTVPQDLTLLDASIATA